MSNKINMKTVDGLVEGLDGKAGVDLANSPYTTNRILEIPQDIKLELSSGTLTLKAGSKVYVPNGFESDGTTPKFDTYTFTNDIQHTNSHNNIDLLCVKPNKTSMFALPAQTNCFSGPTAPSGSYTYAYWYDTATNLIKNTSNGGTTWTSGYSLPVCVATGNSTTTFSSIDQIFNGFGYIGTTAFILPGVKVTLPDGLNDDGTFKNQIRTTTSVEVSNNIHYSNSVIFRGTIVITPTYAGRSYKYMSCSSRYTIPPATNGYILSENKTFQTDASGNITTALTTGNRMGCLVDYTCNGGVVTEWTSHFIDAVVNSNASNFSAAGRSYLSGLGMPSSKYESWTLGASDSTYTAPANGYIYIDGYPNAAIYIIGRYSCVGNASYGPAITCHVRKGETVQIRYTGTMNALRFYYAEGEI